MRLDFDKRSATSNGAPSSPSSQLDFHKRFARDWTSKEVCSETVATLEAIVGSYPGPGDTHGVEAPGSADRRMVSADSSGDTSTWESGSAGHSDGRPPRAPTRLDFDQRSKASTPGPHGRRVFEELFVSPLALSSWSTMFGELNDFDSLRDQQAK